MNRYQFEDLISNYLENDLPLKKRKEFEEYIKKHSDAQDMVDSMRTIIKKINLMPKIKTSTRFNQYLLDKIRIIPSQIDQRVSIPKLLFGFTPLNATIMSGLIISFLFITMLIFESVDTSRPLEKQFYTNTINPNEGLQKKSNSAITKDSLDYYAKNISDSTNNPKKDFSKKIRFVND